MAATEKSEGPKFQVKIKNARLSFPQLWRARAIATDPNSTPKFNASFLFPKEGNKDNPSLIELRRVMKEAMEDKWGKNLPKLKPDRMCLRDGDLENWEGYAGHLYLSASNTRKPRVVDSRKVDGKAVELQESDGRPYAGCYVDAVVRIWIYDDKEYGKRVMCSLEAVQYRAKGEAFGAAPVEDDVFDDLDDGDEDGLGDDKGGSDDDDGGVL